MSYQGDIVENQILYWGFSTRDTVSLPTSLLGSPTGRVYKNDGTVQTSVGITITGAFDSISGQVMVKVDTSDAFYEKQKDYSVFLQAGTVDGGTVAGELVGTFSIENRFMRGTDNAATAGNLATVNTVVDGIQTDLSNEADGLGALKALLDAIPTTAMRGTDSALTDKAGFSLSTAGILALWHQLMSAIVTANTIGKLLKDNLNAAVGNIPTTAMRGTDNAATAGNLATVDTVVDGIQTDLANGNDGLGALKTLLNAIPTTAMRGTNNAALAATAFNVSTDSVKLSATGLDSIPISQVTGPATKWSEMLVQLWRAEHKKRILNKVDSGSGTMSYRNDADDANLLQAAYTEDATDQTMENAS